jgi:hypothetical protein
LLNPHVTLTDSNISEQLCLLQFVGQLVGKGKGQIISSATITTYGGIVLAAADSQPAIGNVVFKAKMIDESKVKAPH